MDDSTIIHYKPDRDGLIGFFNLFDPSIKIGAYLVGVFVLWLTTKRIEQTAEQIRMTENTYKLNSFFKHREEFVKQFRYNDLFKELNRLNKEDFDPDIFNIYNHYYYSSYNNFEPSLNNKARDEMELYINKIADSNINSKDFNFDDISLNELKNLWRVNNSIVSRLCTKINSKMKQKIKNALIVHGDMNEDQINEKTNKFIYANEIYFSGRLYNSILIFDGSTENIWDNYFINFVGFRELLYYSTIKY